MPMTEVTEPGLYDLPEWVYHADPVAQGSASSSTLRRMLPPSCPALARYEADHPVFKDAYDLGSVTHRLILGSGCEIAEVPADSWQTKAARAARDDARERGVVALLSKDLAAAQAMRDAVWADPVASALLSVAGAPELTLVWMLGRSWCRAMLDRWPDPLTGGPIVDVKTSDDLSDEHLRKTIWQYGYHQQEDWYRRGYHAVHDVWADFAFLFVRKTAPHLVRLVQLDDEFRAMGRGRNDEALAVWQDCQDTGIWPGYDSDIALMGPPRWARTRED